MRAAWYERKGSAREVLVVGEMADPEPGPGEVRVRIHASAVNPSDTKQRGGARGAVKMPYPRVIPHQDGAGIVDRVGEGVEGSRVGERVWVYEAQRGSPFGTAADYVVVPARKAVRLPHGTSFVEGACLGVPAMTAHRCVFADGPVEGRDVLVTGGAGAVGFYAIQWARQGNARRVVATISRPEQEAVARRAGAHATVNYRTEPVVDRVRELTEGGVDRIVDVAFGQNLPQSIQLVRANAVIATYSSDAVPEPTLPFWSLLAKDVTVRFVLVYEMSEWAHRAAAEAITSALDGGQLQHQIGARVSLDGIVEAHEAQESGKLIGKAVVELAAEESGRATPRDP